MKNLIYLLSVSLLVFSCQHDEATQQGTAQFSFSKISSSNTGGRKQTNNIPDGASLVISLTKSNGDPVFSWKKLDLLKIGENFITNPLPLMQGNYIITDFMIVDAHDSVLFVAPKAGSPLAGLVTKTIPLTFSVSANAVANVDVEVVDASHKSPEDFGYVSFNVRIVGNTGLSLSAFIVNDNGATELTTAKAYILHGQDTVLKKKLTASVNNLEWDNMPASTYSLVIVKDGYGRYEKNFNSDSLLAQLGGQPLSVLLKPALTITWTPYNANDDFLNIHLAGTPGASVLISWGDGTSQNYGLTVDHTEIHHAYPNTVKYFFSVTGDINSITSVSLFYQIAKIDTMSITHLSGLRNFGMGFFSEYKGDGIDFTHNANLTTIDFEYSTVSLDKLDLSHNPLLNYLNLEAQRIPTPVMNKLIDDIYASTVLLNKRDGGMNLFVSYPSAEIVGHPSPEQVGKLHSLVDDYGWTIYPIVMP